MSMARQNVLFLVAAVLVVMLCVFTLVIRGKAKAKPLRQIRKRRR